MSPRQKIFAAVVFVGGLSWFYSRRSEKRPHIDPNGISNYALPSYNTLTQVGFEFKTWSEWSSMLDQESNYNRFKRVYEFQQTKFPQYSLPKSIVKPEYLERYEKEKGLQLERGQSQ